MHCYRKLRASTRHIMLGIAALLHVTLRLWSAEWVLNKEVKQTWHLRVALEYGGPGQARRRHDGKHAQQVEQNA